MQRTELNENLGCHCPKQSCTHNHTKLRFWGKRVKVVLPKHLTTFFNSCLKTCAYAGEGQHTQDALSWWVNFESSTGDCPTQTILRKELCFRSFFTKRPPGDVDEPAQWDCISMETVWARHCRIPCKAVPGEGELCRAQTGQEAILKSQRDSGKCAPASVPSRTVLAAYSCFLLMESLLQPLSLPRHGSGMNLRGGWCCSRCQVAFCTAVQLGSGSSCQSAHPVIQLFSPWCLSPARYTNIKKNP